MAMAAMSRCCLLCSPAIADSVAGMREEMREACSQGCDVVELRVDHLCGAIPPPTHHVLQQALGALVAAAQDEFRVPVIVTVRAAWEGGQFGGTEAERLQLLKRGVELGADFVDCELKAAPEFMALCRDLLTRGADDQEGEQQKRPQTRVIISHHQFEAAPVDEEVLGDLVARIQASGADVVKFALTPRDISDNAAMFRVLSRTQVPTVALLMGERGLLSRVLAPKYGALLTFGAVSAGRESAPGQPTVADLVSLFRLRGMGTGTRVLGVIGNPVAQSKSPAVHNAALRHCGLDTVYVPLLVDDLRSFLRAFDSPDFAGFSVTLPHKLAALECCHEVEPLAKRIGAVNTIVRRPHDGRLVGYNTDCEAAISAIEQGLGGRGAAGVSPLVGRTFVVLGAGGAGRALAFGAWERGAHVVVANRNAGRAAELAAAVGGTVLPLEMLQQVGREGEVAQFLANLQQQQRWGQDVGKLQEAPPPGPSAVLANSTSVGMHPVAQESPTCAGVLRHFRLVFDAVYNPMRTRLLVEAEAAGAAVVSGVEMFVGQAARQFELFTGHPAPVDLMRRIVLESL